MTKYLWPRQFALVRGETIAAYGVIFDNGQCIVNWNGKYRSTVIWPSYESFLAINGHHEESHIVWKDDP